MTETKQTRPAQTRRTLQKVMDMAATSTHSEHWFTPGAMKFFNSRVHSASALINLTTGMAYFVTSESFLGDSERMYSVRRQDTQGNIETVGTFQGFSSIKAAKEEVKGLALGSIVDYTGMDS